MKKNMMVGLLSVACAGAVSAATYSSWQTGDWSDVTGAKWGSNETGSWASTLNLPTSGDSVVLNGSKSKNLDIDATIAALTVSAGSTLTAGVTGKTLTVTGATTVNGSLAVSGGNLAFGTATFNTSVDITSGSVTLGTGTSQNNASLTIDGGTLSFDNSVGSANLSGTGTIYLNSGTLSSGENFSTSINNDIVISGGIVDMNFQTLFTGDVSIIGDAAVIDIVNFNGNNGGSLNYVMGEDGVSMVDSSASWSHLLDTEITVDGTDYTGGEGVFELFRSANLASMSSDYDNVSGFSDDFLGTVYQEGHSVYLRVESVPEPATMGLMAVAGGVLLFMRKRLRA